MKKHLARFTLTVCLTTALMIVMSGCGSKASLEKLAKSAADSAQAIEDISDREKVIAATEEFLASGTVAPFFENSYGYAIFPTIGKGGVGIGGAHGAGWVFRKGKLTGLSKMTQVTIGFQLGGQAFSQIIFFEDVRAYEDFTSGNFEFGAQASAVAITAGANASADTAGGASAGAGSKQTKTGYTGGMAIFTHAKGGLMYEASIGGQKFNFDDL